MSDELDVEQVERCRRWAALYRAKGWNVLPCRPDEKRPAVRFKAYQTSPAPADLFDRHPCAAMQVMLGRAFGLLVLDLDGDAAKDWWRANHAASAPVTWTTHSGGNGLHLWFRVSKEGRPIRKAVLWTDGAKHSAVERLCDGSLIVAPPSRHSAGRTYQFVDRARSPAGMPLPAPAPFWLLDLPPVNVRPRPADPSPRVLTGRFDVRDKIGLARRWGVKFTGRVNGDWHECHAIDRPDTNASAAVHRESGYYRDLGPSDARYRFLDLAVALGAYHDWREAADDLRRNHGC